MDTYVFLLARNILACVLCTAVGGNDMLPTFSTPALGEKKEVVDVLEFYLKRTNTDAL